MARYVIDAPTLLHVVSHAVDVDPTHRLVAPNSIRSEALESMFQAVRRGEIDEATALGWHERTTELKMRLLGDRVSRRTAWNIAREHDWPSLRDAEYLAVCRLQADALVTVDAAFAERASGIVAVAPLSALSEASVGA